MKRFVQPLLGAVILVAFSLKINAQAPPPTAPEIPVEKGIKEERIIIKKKGDIENKYKIEIDGDDITVNGKPLDEFTSDEIDIDEIDIATDRLMPRLPGEFQGSMNFNKFFRDGTGNKAFLGVMTQKADTGAKIEEVTKGSPAEKAGLLKGDVILKIDNESISGPDDLFKAIGRHKENDVVEIVYKRDNAEKTAKATLTANKEMRVYGFKGDKDFDFKFSPPIAPDAPYFFHMSRGPRMGVQAQDTEDGKGIKVLEVEEGSPAEKAGLKKGDIITQLNEQTITTVDALRGVSKDFKDGDVVKVTYRRDNKTQTTSLTFPRDLKVIDL